MSCHLLGYWVKAKKKKTIKKSEGMRTKKKKTNKMMSGRG